MKAMMLLGALLLTGCASMYEGMGIASKDTVTAQSERLQALEKQVTDIGTRVEKISDTSQRVAEVEALLKKLQGRVDQLPQETLRKLADALNKAAAAADTKTP